MKRLTITSPAFLAGALVCLTACSAGGGGASPEAEVSPTGHASAALTPATKRPSVDFGARTTLEYHAVAAGADTSLGEGLYVTTGHIARLGRLASTSRDLVTFDDGYASVYELALPVLRRANLPALAAIITEATRDSGSPDARADRMSRAELAALVAAGWSMAYHASTVAEHELNFHRLALVLQSGAVYGVNRDLAAVDVFDPAAGVYLSDNTGESGAANDALLEDLRAARRDVLMRVDAGANADEATIDVLAARFRAGRARLASLAGVLPAQVDTLVYPHSESDYLVWAAAQRGGFARAYAGGPIGDRSNAYNKPRKWMNDATPIP